MNVSNVIELTKVVILLKNEKNNNTELITYAGGNFDILPNRGSQDAHVYFQLVIVKTVARYNR